jgi:PAP2 superfamily protein
MMAIVHRRVRLSIRQLEYMMPAIVLLWIPVLLAVWGRLPGTRQVQAALPMLGVLLLGGVGPLLIAAGIARLRERSAVGALGRLWSDGWLTERPVRHLLMSVSLAAFFWAFACWKSAIPIVHPFAWDERLWAAGYWLHRGQLDVVLAPWFGRTRALIALDHLYETWWFVLLAMLLWQIWQPDLEKSKRFLLAFALVWVVLGIFMATGFSSAGPCFARLLTGTHRYDQLLARLREANAVSPLMAVRGQAYLWEAYTKGFVPPGGGISAFPSLHVGGAALCALSLGQRSRLAGGAGWIYVLLTWIGSIMLGWHYGLDGEVAVVAVVMCWKVAGWITAPVPEHLLVIDWSWRKATPALEQPMRRPEPATSVAPRAAWTFWP